MKKYYKYILVSMFVLFSFYYTDKIITMSEHNNVIMNSIVEYASNNDYKCREGEITSDGIILGLSGLSVNKNKSYSNMKGIGFKKELIEYNDEECILSKSNNLDKYIIKGNNYLNNISIVIDVNDGKNFLKMMKIADNKGYTLNLLFNYEMLNSNIDNISNYSNVLFKGKNKEDVNNFMKILHDEFYCTNKDGDIIEVCENKKLNSINVINYISKDLLINTKKILDKGVIIFIKENEFNLSELSATLNYIKSRGYNIVSINDLLL